ncbi:hypothetical protein FHS42_004317 [Streptomyces zagrosensis]|uniref:Uncharacterized protein n=1 Tax=Streptomyces zagrosensis TaxID=1042984 RepID=A0A7W9QBL0_9ACTN|nr:hypothetical protein [Streptomyces zagrosensis]
MGKAEVRTGNGLFIWLRSSYRQWLSHSTQPGLRFPDQESGPAGRKRPGDCLCKHVYRCELLMSDGRFTATKTSPADCA